jgi:hypothetical protein
MEKILGVLHLGRSKTIRRVSNLNTQEIMKFTKIFDNKSELKEAIRRSVAVEEELISIISSA